MISNKSAAIELIDLWYEKSGMLKPNIIFCNSISDIQETSRFLREEAARRSGKDCKEFSITLSADKYKYSEEVEFEELSRLISLSGIQELAPFEDFCFVY